MNILIALDGSTCSERAVEFVSQRLYKPEDKFLLLTVVEPIPSELGFADKNLAAKERESRMAPLLATAEKLVERARKKISGAHPENSVQTEIVTGMIVNSIIEKAESFPATLIIMGSHGRQGLDHILLGSVAEEVLHNAPCSVEVVK